MFYSESNRPKTIPMPKTNKYEPEYKEVLNKNGKKELKEVGKINVYEKIQEARAGSALDEITKKYLIKINDMDLTKLEEAVTDLTNVPTNLIETMNVINNAKEIYESAPAELKNRFNNNFTEFIAGAQNGTLESLLKKKEIKEAIKQEDKSLLTQLEETKAKLAELQKGEKHD